jgi:hypothetical protein
MVNFPPYSTGQGAMQSAAAAGPFPPWAISNRRAATPYQPMTNYVPILFYPASSFFVPRKGALLETLERSERSETRISRSTRR